MMHPAIVSLLEMLKAYARTYSAAMVTLVDCKWDLAKGGSLSPELTQRLNLAISMLEESCRDCELVRVLPELKRLRATVDMTPASNTTPLSLALKHLVDRLDDELTHELFLRLNPVDAKLHGDLAPFGPKVSKKFPRTREDLQEAAKCLAVNQPTAAVFHLMRAMESAVKRIGARIGVTNTEKEWGKILSDIDGYVESLPKATEAEKKVRRAWSAAHANLYHVKEASRNDTMHPKSTYTIEQAREVYAATRSFMVHLAGMI